MQIKAHTTTTSAENKDIIERKLAEEALRESEVRFRRLVEMAPEAIFIQTDGRFAYVNTAALRLFGAVRLEELLGQPVLSRIHPRFHALASDRIRLLNELRQPVPILDMEYLKLDNSPVQVSVAAIPFPYLNQNGALVFVRDVTERKKAEEALRDSEMRYRIFINATSDMVFLKDESFRYLISNGANSAFMGKSEAGVIGCTDFDLMPEEAAKHCRASDQEALENGGVVATEESVGPNTYQIIKFPVPLPGGCVGVGGFIRDITERKRAEADKAKLEAELQQAQKMESVGRLAGGVAHDFNNMLHAILGNADLAMKEMSPGSPGRDSLEVIRDCARRSADLTQQLLAFARKQTVAPKVLDLNATVAGMLKMLQRLIGENIRLVWQPGEDLWPVKMDPSQIDQILANLCINARDAITDVGTITIGTANSVFDEQYCAAHPGFAPGEYVRLAVSDSGCGMDPEMLSHLFEPFFTTKGIGKGTGLGLATVYGAVKQNSGFINVCSELGKGTTLAIYLPWHKEMITQIQNALPVEKAALGRGAILLVEDDPSILKIIAMQLRSKGYTVLTAGSPGEAIRLAREHAGKIDLLMTDIVMPEMNGWDLAKYLLARDPNLKSLYMSGYPADIITDDGILDEGLNFLQKPFSAEDLAAKLQEVLGK